MSLSAPSTPAGRAFASWAQTQLEAARGALAALEKLPASADTATVVAALQDLGLALDAGCNRAALMRAVSPDAEVRELASLAEQSLAQVHTEWGLSRPTYAALARLPAATDPHTQRLIAHSLRDLRRAGVDKPPEVQAQIRRLKQELVEIGQAFEKNIRTDVRQIRLADAKLLAGLPADYVERHPPAADGSVQIGTDTPDYIPFMSYAHDDASRRQLYLTYRQRGFPQNEAVLQQLRQKRFALAQLLGATDWADFVTADKMIGSKQAAQAFIDKVADLSRPRARADAAELLAELQQDVPDAREVMDWQKTYLEERVRNRRYSYDAQAARQYFPFARVLDGLLRLTEKLYGVQIRPLEAPVWHPSVRAYALFEGSEPAAEAPEIGRFFLDLHPRPDKYKHAAAFPLRSGVAGVQVPSATLVCNFPEGDAALLEHNDVSTFFHEFGHLLHHLFAGGQRYLAQSGIATEWDFVEAPSQMFEEWTFDLPTLQGFARRADGACIEAPLVEAMRRARDFGKGLWVQQQMFYSALSLRLHADDPATQPSGALARATQRAYAPFAYVPETHFELSFGHLEGYSAIYYTYMWSLVIAKDLFSRFAAEGLHNPQTAADYRQQVLAPGGSRDAADLVRGFLRRPFEFTAFGRWLER